MRQHTWIPALQGWRATGCTKHYTSNLTVIDFGKHICDLLLVHHYLGPILSLFRDIAGFLLKNWSHPYSTLILGCSRWTRSPKLWSMSAGTSSAVKVFSKYSNLGLCDHGTWTLQTDRRTYDWTARGADIQTCSISPLPFRGVKQIWVVGFVITDIFVCYITEDIIGL